MNHMLIFGPLAYVTFVYNLLWRIGMIILADIATGDINDIDFMHLHGP